jgi:lactate dehydrogenase-like 2-hydroxyacid dehydrogenase
MTFKDIHILHIGPHGVDKSAAELERTFTVHRWWEVQDQEKFLKETGPLIRGIAGQPYPWKQDPAFLGNFPALEITTVFGAGYDSIDMPMATKRGIIVTNTPGAAADETADGAMGLLLTVVREFRQAEIFLRESEWLKGRYPLTPSLRNRTVGILGLGRIGKAIATRCAGFGLEIAYHGRNEQPSEPYTYYPSLLNMARNVSVLMISAPGSPETNAIVNGEVLQALGPEGILINVGRGTIVDEPALISALKTNIIFGAGLDVTANEPNVAPELLELKNVVVLPHIAGASTHTWKVMADMMNDNLKSWFAGKGPLTPVPETPFKTGN